MAMAACRSGCSSSATLAQMSLELHARPMMRTRRKPDQLGVCSGAILWRNGIPETLLSKTRSKTMSSTVQRPATGSSSSRWECTASEPKNKEVRCSTEGQGQTQTIKNETLLANKAPLQSKEKSPKLDDGGTGLPPRDGDGGGGGGGGGGGWGGGGFVFWALLLLIGFLRDRELDKPFEGPKRKKKQKRRQFT